MQRPASAIASSLRVARAAHGRFRKRLCLAQIGIQRALHRALLPAGVARVEILGQPVHGERRLLRAEGRVHHPRGRAGDELFALAVHELRDAFRLREPQLLRLAETGNGLFHGADLHRVADLPEAALVLARCLTAHGKDSGKGAIFS